MLKMAACAATAWAALAAPSFAETFSNNWWFVDLDTGQTVGGVISGLVNGENLSAEGLVITVTQSPYDSLLGEYAADFSAGAGYPSHQDTYSASNGLITMANFIYTNEISAFFTFGSNPAVGFYPQIINYGDVIEQVYNNTAGIQFSVVDAGVPEPATWALMVGGFGLAGAAVRRRQRLAA